MVMSTKIKESSSIEVVVDVVDATCAAVESDPATRALAPTWAALRDKADGLAENGRKLDRDVLRARARLGVQDSQWDATVAAFGRAVLDASGGRRDQAPYTRFFGKTTPSAAQDFGIGREIELGRSWLAELARNPNEPLAQTWSPKVKEATDALEMACNQRNDTVKALGPQRTSVVLFIDDVNRELDRLEGDLKKLFPGNTDRVASYLAATRRSAPESEQPAAAPSPTGR
jgi:hypothetical protein